MARVANASVWLAGPRFDIPAFFAPALLSLVAFTACVVFRASPLPWLWLWIALFDGPHMLATYTRAYGDGELWRTRRRLLVLSPLSFAVGPGLLLLGAALSLPQIFTTFLALMSTYAFHHVVRQHWGFASLYGVRAGARAGRSERLWFYGACWAPYVAFLLTHPALRAEVGAPESLVGLGHLAGAAALVFAGIANVRYAGRFASAWRDGRPLQQPAYLLLIGLFHVFLFGFVARFEPIFAGAQGLDQVFMLLSLMNGMFHSAQYVALVGLFHQKSVTPEAGPPTWFGGRPVRTLLTLVPFVALYLGVACGTGVYPGCQVWPGRQVLAGVSWSQLWLGIWWGFALHHYWLDERIWHVRSDPRLKRIFSISPPSPA